MQRSHFDTLGDEQKKYEQAEAGRATMLGLPIIARLDGRGFHNFTKGLERPYDFLLSECMLFTAKHLIEEFHCDIAYTQSDEITLIWKNEFNEKRETKVGFSGKYQKLVSLLAATATGYFREEVAKNLPAKVPMRPMFDCRVWQVPNLQSAAENLLWREMDATKNSITMAAHTYYSHKELEGKHSGDKHEMLFAKGINWNDYPNFFKKGSYLVKKKELRHLTKEELDRIPEKYRPEEAVERTTIRPLNIPKATSIQNLVGVYFMGEEPICKLSTDSGNQQLPIQESTDSSESIGS